MYIAYLGHNFRVTGSDLHTANVNGPVYDLVTVMTKFLHLGMPLVEIIRAVTSTPAQVYGIDDVTGSLSVGKEADITVIKIVDCDILLDDSIGQMRLMKKCLKPIAVWRMGVLFEIKETKLSTKSPSQARTIESWDRAIITDEMKPVLN